MISIAWRMSVKSIFIMNWYFFSNGVQFYPRNACFPMVPLGIIMFRVTSWLPRWSKTIQGNGAVGPSMLREVGPAASNASCLPGALGLKDVIKPIPWIYPPPLPTPVAKSRFRVGWYFPKCHDEKVTGILGGRRSNLYPRCFWFRFLDVWLESCQVTQAAEMRPKSKLPSVLLWKRLASYFFWQFLMNADGVSWMVFVPWLRWHEAVFLVYLPSGWLGSFNLIFLMWAIHSLVGLGRWWWRRHFTEDVGR